MTCTALMTDIVPPYELAGPAEAPAIAVLGGISASKHVSHQPSDSSDGWWEGVVGEGCGIDTRASRVVSFDWLDGGRAPDGRPARRVSTYEQADALAAVLDEAGIDRVEAIVGASYGGMVALAFAERHPARVGRVVVNGAAHESHPMSTGIRAIQRRIVELGLDTGRARDGLALARALGMTTYRSAREFAERFEPGRIDEDGTFDVERYLLHHGERFAATWRPERFLALSLSTDTHRVTPEAIATPAVLIAAEGDTLVPREQLIELSRRLAGPNVILDFPTRYGHDAFLAEPERFGETVAHALTLPLA